MIGSYGTNTLGYDEGRCSGCGLCVIVCPHGVFAENGSTVRLARAHACMECGACQRNCPTGAIEVDSGVGCATALFYAALTGREACCGPRDEPCCWGEGDTQGQAADEVCSGPSDEPCCGRAESPPGDLAESGTDGGTPASCCGTAADSTGRCCSDGASKEDE